MYLAPSGGLPDYGNRATTTTATSHLSLQIQLKICYAEHILLFEFKNNPQEC